MLGGGLEFSPSFTHQVMLWHKPRGRDTFLTVLFRKDSVLPSSLRKACLLLIFPGGRREEG